MILLTAMSSPDGGRVRPAFETAVLLAGAGALMLPADWTGSHRTLLSQFWVKSADLAFAFLAVAVLEDHQHVEGAR